MDTSTPNSPLPSGGACRLSDRGVIRAVGADAASFLHGQLSNDVSRLGSAQARLGAYCSPQGRMLASLVFARSGPEELWLSLSADVLAPTLKRLSMFVLRAKARLSDASAELAVVGLAGTSAAAWLGEGAPATPWDKADRDGAMVIRLQPARLDGAEVPLWLWIGPVAQAEALLAALPALQPSQWARLELATGVAQVTAATSGQFVPQMLNYELVGGVDFRKGCYPGQEVVARSQYLGKLKRRGFLLGAAVPMRPGQEIFWSEDAGQPAGVIAAAAPELSGSGHAALAEMKIAVTQSGTLHLGAADGPPLALLPLPYALPHEAAAATSA